jgi:IclR family transcriptional regulator, pca regulon regulatory protein
MSTRSLSAVLESEEAGWLVPTLRDPRYSQSLERGLAMLRRFTPARPVMAISEIATELGMSRSTTHRYVVTLVAPGYLEQSNSRKYRLGLGVTDLGMSALNSTGLREHAHSYLYELRERTSYTASIGVLDGIAMVYADRVRSLRPAQNQLDMQLANGSRVPAYATAIGKLLLSSLTVQEQRQRIAEMTLRKCTPHTITSKKALREHLQEIQQRRLAVNNQELAAGLYAIAVPVRDAAGDTVAAINLTVASETISLQELKDALASHLYATADRISARLGYRREDELMNGRGR